MSGRGPIRRKAGERKRARDNDDATPDPLQGGHDEHADGPDGGEDGDADGLRRGPAALRPPAHDAGGPSRRVFDPGRPRRAGERRGPSDRPGPPGPRRAGPPGGPPGRGPGGKPPRAGGKPAAPREETGPEAEKRAAEQEQAKLLAKDKGIPLVHALRVVRGETTLNDVLKAMMRKERAQRLIERDGLDPGLAGQVASGHLSRERALQIQKIRRHRQHRLDRDAFKVAQLERRPVALLPFGGDWIVGRISDARTYEVDVAVHGAEPGTRPETLQKHDVKALCAASDLDAVRAGLGADEAVKAEGLAGTAERAERVRPTDERLLEYLDNEQVARCVLRDGDTFAGTVRSFGRWDVDLLVGDGAVVTVLFHALHPSSDLVG